jgi:hypothetical protein
MAAVLVSFSLATLAYMVSVIFELRGLRNWAKAEFYQALASAVIVSGLMLLTTLMFNVGVKAMIGTDINPFQRSMDYLDGVLKELSSLYTSTYDQNFLFELLPTFTFYINAAAFSIKPFFWLTPTVITKNHLITQLITTVAITTSFQKALIFFFVNTGFAVFLPLGVILRAFPLTRGAGGLIIAIAIGFFIVYPVMFTYVSLMSEAKPTVEEITGSMTFGGLELGQFSAGAIDFENATEFANSALNPQVAQKVDFIFGWLGPVAIKIFYYPVVVFMVTLTFIRTISPLLGADITEIGQGLVKLI